MLHIKSSKLKRASFDHSSTQIDLPLNMAKKVIEWGNQSIPDVDIYHEEGERSYGREEDIHCTVKYGLHTTNASDVRKQVQGFGKFNIELGEVSRFVPPNKPYEVVKIAVEGDRLHQLNGILSELPNSDEHPEYKAHITIAYIKSGTNYNLSGNRPFCGIKIPVTEITFSPKDGDKVSIPL